MKTGGERRRFPGVGWLSSRLTRKVIAGLVVMAILSWLVMCWCFLLYLGAYAGHAYDAVLSDAESAAQRTAAFLEGCGGDYAQFQTYLIERGMGCTVRDSGGGLLFEYQPYGGEEGDISASGGAPARLPGGQELEVRVWVRAMGRQDISRTVGRGGLVGMLVLNICVFVVVALMLYFLVVAPIIRLRRTMQRYYESGERPERTQRMDEVGRLQNTFADLAGVLESKERAEHHLIASISHDIKTPLTSVMGYSERLLSAGLPPEKQRQYLQNVHEKALAIKSIVDEFDEYIDVGLRDTAPMRLITAGELCQRLRAEYQDELLDADVRLTVECACPGDQIICNWEHMRRFFGNLIGNAIQHAEASRLELRLQCRREEGQVVFLFSDNGRGVQEDLIQQIFEPLYTSDRGRKVSGLGLSICKSIITAHGGTIGARNRAEGGLEIQASLPRVDI